MIKAGFRSEQDVFYDSAGPMRDTKPSSSAGSLSTLEAKSPLNTAGSRKPLHVSISEAEALNNILSCGPYPLKSGNKSNESGYFSGSSKLSLGRITLECCQEQNGLDADEMDKFNKEELEALLFEIAEEFGGCWKELGRHLLRKECSIENIDADYSKVSEKSYQMLHKWFIEKASKASVKDIFKCLIRIGKEEVADKVLEYLPDIISRECEMVLLSSPRKIRCASMTTPIYNITEHHRDLTVEKQLRLQEDEEVYVCCSNITKKRYLLKEIEESPKVYRWAARMLIPEKELKMKMKTLRKTNEFLRDLQLKEETVKRLKSIIEKLQEKVHIKHITFCLVELKCTSCEKTALMRELLDKDLSLLHHELLNMIRGSKRLSVSGMQTERIYDLAERAYSVCEEHKKFHAQVVKLPRRCSMEILDSDDTSTETESDEFDDPLQCTLNILRHLGRKRKVVQSLTIKERKRQSKKVQRHSSDKVKSRFYVPRYVLEQETTPRSNWPTRMGSKFFGQRKRSTEKKERRKSNEKQKKNDLDKGNKTQESQLSGQRPQGSQLSSQILRGREDFLKPMYHPRSNTFPSLLVDLNGNTAGIYDPQELYLDDVNDSTGSMFSCMKDLRISEASSRIPHQQMHMSSSDSNLRMLASRRKGVTQFSSISNPGLRDSPSPGVFEMLTQKKFLFPRQRSWSENEVTQVTQRYQVFDDSSVQQCSSANNVLWKTEIDPDTIFFV